MSQNFGGEHLVGYFERVTDTLKKTIRTRVLTLLRTQKEEDRLKKSLVILGKLFKAPEFVKAKSILFYASFDAEVETFEMIKQAKQLGKRIALPIILTKEKRIVPIGIENCEEDLELGPYGIKQPRYVKKRCISVEDIDLVVVPGVAFDKNNNRLGRGAGYYDRFLANLPQDIPTIGLAFDFQLVPRLPQQSHDRPVSRVIVN